MLSVVRSTTGAVVVVERGEVDAVARRASAVDHRRGLDQSVPLLPVTWRCER